MNKTKNKPKNLSTFTTLNLFDYMIHKKNRKRAKILFNSKSHLEKHQAGLIMAVFKDHIKKTLNRDSNNGSKFPIKKRLQHRCFPLNILTLLRTAFLTPLVAASVFRAVFGT